MFKWLLSVLTDAPRGQQSAQVELVDRRIETLERHAEHLSKRVDDLEETLERRKIF